jgi:aconitate hydratase
MGDDVSTDEILPAGAKVLPFRSNLQRISDFAFEPIDPDYSRRARALGAELGHVVIGGENYGKDHRANTRRGSCYLGLRVLRVSRGFTAKISSITASSLLFTQ